MSITIPCKTDRVALCGKNDFFSLSQLVDLNYSGDPGDYTLSERRPKTTPKQRF